MNVRFGKIGYRNLGVKNLVGGFFLDMYCDAYNNNDFETLHSTQKILEELISIGVPIRVVHETAYTGLLEG